MRTRKMREREKEKKKTKKWKKSKKGSTNQGKNQENWWTYNYRERRECCRKKTTQESHKHPTQIHTQTTTANTEASITHFYTGTWGAERTPSFALRTTSHLRWVSFLLNYSFFFFFFFLIMMMMIVMVLMMILRWNDDEWWMVMSFSHLEWRVKTHLLIDENNLNQSSWFQAKKI